MWSDHKDLIERLGYVLGHCESRYMKGDYKELKGVLLEIETRAMKTLIRAPLKLSLFNIYTDSRMRTRTESHSTFNCMLPLKFARDLRVIGVAPMSCVDDGSRHIPSALLPNCYAVILGSGGGDHYSFYDSW